MRAEWCAAREAAAAEWRLWAEQKGFGGLMQPSPTISSGRHHVPSLRNAGECRSCKKGRYSPVMIKVTETRAITPYLGVRRDEER